MCRYHNRVSVARCRGVRGQSERFTGSGGALALCPHAKLTPKKRDQELEDASKRRTHTEGEAGANRRGGDCDRRKPMGKQGHGCIPSMATRGENGHRNSSRLRHTERGTETSGGI